MLTKKEIKERALENIKELFKEADKAKTKKSADRYVQMARKIAMKNNLRIPRELKRKFCKHCYSYFRPGKNLQVRTQKNRVVYTCLDCKKIMRFVFS